MTWIFILFFALKAVAAEPLPLQVPVNQVLTPAGLQVDLPGMRPQVLALSPDRTLLATSGKSAELVLVDPSHGNILQKVGLAQGSGTKDDQVSYTGLVFSADGKRLYLSNVNGSVEVFQVRQGNRIEKAASLDLPSSGLTTRAKDIPSGLALSKDGKVLYVALNLSNRLLEMDAYSGQVLRLWNVGVAPYDVRLVGRKVYVSNWGGRRPEDTSLTGPAGKGTRVRVDPLRHIASEGSVSVIDLAANTVKEVVLGLHASGMALSPSGSLLAVANAGSDTVSMLDTSSDEVIQTLPMRWGSGALLGASPNALAFDAGGKILYVCNGTQNAVAVVGSEGGKFALQGLLPTGWYPGAVCVDAKRKQLLVANIKGMGSGGGDGKDPRKGFNSHQYRGTLSLIPIPDKAGLARQTEKVLENNRAPLERAALLPARPGQAPKPIPERPGEPSLFKHVVYIIKENRTYDQVLGDMPEGDGDPSLCIFGEPVTPNLHQIARDFVLLDNTYCSGILSADGHQWADSAFATDYMERSFAGFPRSYPDGMDDDDVDALAYSSAGFLWDAALAHGKTLRVYGEFSITRSGWRDRSKKGQPGFKDFYADFLGGNRRIWIKSRPAIESLRPYICADTAGWDLKIPDVFRADVFIRELHAFEKNGGFPDLMIVCLPNDHSSGTNPGSPTPEAQVADNDLAMGRILEALSHSRFWKDTCLFAVEDDPQDGWDHVSAYRTTAFVASPYTKRRQTIHTNFNQTGIVRSMELILGLPPMNQMDASATPLFDAFQDSADLTPYVALANKIPLDRMNPEKEAILDPMQRQDAIASSRLPLGSPDKCPEALLNEILWRSQKGSVPYPTWALKHY